MCRILGEKTKNKKYISTANNGLIVKRKLIISKKVKPGWNGSPSQIPHYKFYEKLTFGKNKPKAICIGLNPKNAWGDIDGTNKKIIDLIKNNYSGYYLYNIFPEITQNSTQITTTDNVNISFFKKTIMKKCKGKKQIILFFGRTMEINAELETWILENSKRIKLTINTTKNLFEHPAYCNNLSLDDFINHNIIVKNGKKYIR